MDLVVDPLRPDHEAAAEALLDAEVAGRHQARASGLHDVLALPGFVATVSGRVVGVVTFDPTTHELAVLAVDHDHGNRGIGGRLVEAVADALRSQGAERVWLVTTNDNLDALRLYQRHEFRIAEVHPGAVDQARAVHKPSIPMIGAHGIPLRDELVLQRDLR